MWYFAVFSAFCSTSVSANSALKSASATIDSFDATQLTLVYSKYKCTLARAWVEQGGYVVAANKKVIVTYSEDKPNLCAPYPKKDLKLVN